MVKGAREKKKEERKGGKKRGVRNCTHQLPLFGKFINEYTNNPTTHHKKRHTQPQAAPKRKRIESKLKRDPQQKLTIFYFFILLFFIFIYLFFPL